MEILENYNLKNLNTFNISVFAKFFVKIKNEDELQELFTNLLFIKNNKLFLGGGSNVLFTKDFDGMVVFNQMKGIKILASVPKEAEKDDVYIRAMGGEIWDDLVSFAVDKNYWGIENLALIPGMVGAAPMQNVGAYGAELKDVLINVEAYEISSGQKRIFTKDECALGYRDSIFKNSLKNKYFITAITIKLSKEKKLNTKYKILSDYLEENNIKVDNSKTVSEAVSFIRRSKLPDPKVFGNAGSFFKNVFLEKEKFEELINLYPDMPYFKEETLIKVPAGYFIEQCDWKGKRVDSVGVYEKQALVLVNYGEASGQDIKKLADEIIRSVFDKFKIVLTPEVNLIP